MIMSFSDDCVQHFISIFIVWQKHFYKIPVYKGFILSPIGTPFANRADPDQADQGLNCLFMEI